MVTAEMVHETGYFSYADAEHLADLWNRAYPAMRQIATGYVEGLRLSVERKSWEIDPKHPQAEVLRELATPENKVRRKLKLAEDLRRELGQVDRGTHKLCTRSPGHFTVTGANMTVRNLIRISSLSSEGLGEVFRLAAMLAEAEEKVNAERAEWYRQNKETEK